MKKQLTTFLLALAVAVQVAVAVPARRGVLHTVTQPDGTTVTLQRVGDENAHFYVTTDRVPVMADATGRYCFARLDASGRAVASDVQAADASHRDARQTAYVAALDRPSLYKSLSASRSRMAVAPRRANASSGIGLEGALFPHEGDVNALVILVEFSNKKFTVPNPEQYYEDFLNKEGFAQHNATGSCRDYFMSVSDGKFRPKFDVYGPVTLGTMATYGANDFWGNDVGAGQMVYEACKKLDSSLDFSKYDLNGDGFVDNVYIIYAGQGEASYGTDDTIWPHRWVMKYAYGSDPMFDGVYVSDYGCCNEYDRVAPTGIGTFCHEFGHVMGLPDLYTTDYNEAALIATPGDWDIMDHGSYNNDGRTPPSYSAYERNAMGWLNLIEINGPASIDLPAITDSNSACIINTGDPNEFFLLENRQQKGWDAHVPGHGMLVWHIDFDINVWKNNEVNNDAKHNYVDIEEAGGIVDNEDVATMATYAFPGTSRVTSITDDTKPYSLRTWDNKGLGLPVTDITEKNGIVSFDVAGGIVDLGIPVPVLSAVTGDGFTVTWQPVEKAFTYTVDVTDADGNPVEGFTGVEVSECTFTARHLTAETAYGVAVTARRAANASKASDMLAVTTGPLTFDVTVPRALSAENVGGNNFTARWEPVDGATGYLLTVVAHTQGSGSTETNDFGAGNSLKMPEGWTSNSSAVYGSNSTGYFGKAAPSIKLAKIGQYVMSPVYADDIVSASLWYRRAGVNGDNYFEVQGLKAGCDGSDDSHFVLLHKEDMVEASSSTVTVDNIPSGIRAIRVVYQKVSSGNLAVDDMTVTLSGEKNEVLAGYDAREVGNVTSFAVGTEGSAARQFTYTVKAVNADGLRTYDSNSIDVDLDTHSVADVEAAASFSVTATDGILEISAADDSTVTVTDLSGRTVATVTGSATLSVAAGVYVVSDGATAVKIAVK